MVKESADNLKTTWQQDKYHFITLGRQAGLVHWELLVE